MRLPTALGLVSALALVVGAAGALESGAPSRRRRRRSPGAHPPRDLRRPLRVDRARQAAERPALLDRRLARGDRLHDGNVVPVVLHLAAVGLVIHAKQMQHRMQQQNADFIFHGVFPFPGLRPRAIERNGDIALDGECQNVGGIILIAELPIE